MASNDDDLSAVISQDSGALSPVDDLSAVSQSQGLPQTQPPGLFSKGGPVDRWTDFATRGLAHAAASVPELVGDPLVAGYNKLAPHLDLPKSPLNVTQAVNLGLQKLDVAEPKTLGEELGTAGIGFVGGLGAPGFGADTLLKSGQQALNGAWARAIGSDSEKITSRVLSRAYGDMGDVFDSVRDATKRGLDTEAVGQFVSKLDDDFSGMFTNVAQKVSDHPLVQKLLQFGNDGEATAEQLGKLSSQLGKSSTKQFTAGDADLGDALSQVKEAVDDVVEHGLSGDQLAKYQQARQQYRSMSQLLKSRALNVDTGDIDAQALGSFLQRTDRTGYAMGRNSSEAYEATHSMRAAGPASKLWQSVPVLGPWAESFYRAGLLPGAIKGTATGINLARQNPLEIGE